MFVYAAKELTKNKTRMMKYLKLKVKHTEMNDTGNSKVSVDCSPVGWTTCIYLNVG